LLVSAVVSVLVAPHLSSPPAFDALTELTPITGIGTVPAVLVVRPSLGIKTFAQFLAYARANPGKLNLATSGAGTISHLTGELLKHEIGINIVPVHYRGAPLAVTDMLGDHADFMFSDAPFFLEHIKVGKLVPLAVGTPERSPSLPDVPTTAELGYPTIVASNTSSLFGPPKLPSDIVAKLSDLALKELRKPEVRAAFTTQAATSAGASPSAFAAQVETEAKRWLPLVKAAGIVAN
jgi:tripartite-type tricarboxylate transporter receptor subunit TctC